MGDKIKIEKLIAQINDKLFHYHSKVILDKREDLTPKLDEINENIVREFIRNLVFSDEDPKSMDEYSENELKTDFIKKEKCDINYAEKVIEKMKQSGLELCKLPSTFSGKNINQMFFSDHSPTYSIMRFASIQGYFTMDEFSKITTARSNNRPERDSEED